MKAVEQHCSSTAKLSRRRKTKQLKTTGKAATKNKKKRTKQKRNKTHTNKKHGTVKIIAKIAKKRLEHSKTNKRKTMKTKEPMQKWIRIHKQAHPQARARKQTCARACSCACVTHVCVCACIHHCVCDSSKENFNVLDQVYGIRGVRAHVLCSKKKKRE